MPFERDKAVRQLQKQKDGERHRINFAVSRATEEKEKTIPFTARRIEHILTLFADMFYKANEIFKRDVNAIIQFGK